MKEATLRALRIIDKYQVESPKQFAFLMWPDSPRWQGHTKCGANGISIGGGMNLAAGGYLGRLRKRGLIAGSKVYYLTEKGKKELS